MPSTRKEVTQALSTLPSAPSATLLLAGPDPRTVAALQQVFEAAGFSVVTAYTAPKVLRQVRESHPYLVILDMALSRQSTLCAKIKAANTSGFLPVITLVESDWREDDPDSGADASILKPVDHEGLLASVRSLLRVKKQIDKLIQENRALAASSRAVELLKSDIITNVSHELSTPLVQVKAAVSLLVEEVNQAGPRSEPSVADMASQAVARLEGVVENIRQLAQTHNIRFGPVVVEDAVDLAIRHLERSWASRGARDRIEKHIEPRLPVVLADKRAMARLLQLMIDNALKFSDGDAPVYVLAYRVGKGHVWLGVQDFGIGIAPEEHARIFEAFYQVDGSSTRRYGGTGTGLALAMLLAKGMNTEIKLESKLGEGSTFSFLLPVTTLVELGGQVD